MKPCSLAPLAAVQCNRRAASSSRKHMRHPLHFTWLAARISCSTHQWCTMSPSHCILSHLTGRLLASLAAHTSGARCAHRIASHCISPVDCSHLLQHTPVVRDVLIALHLIASHRLAARISCSTHQWCTMSPSHCISLHLTGRLLASLAAHTSGARCAHRIASHCISPVDCSHLLQHTPVVRDVPSHSSHCISPVAARISCSTHQWCAMCHRIASHCISPVGCSHLLQHTPVVRDVPIALHLIASHRLAVRISCSTHQWCAMCPSHRLIMQLIGLQARTQTSGAATAHPLPAGGSHTA